MAPSIKHIIYKLTRIIITHQLTSYIFAIMCIRFPAYNKLGLRIKTEMGSSFINSPLQNHLLKTLKFRNIKFLCA